MTSVGMPHAAIGRRGYSSGETRLPERLGILATAARRYRTVHIRAGAQLLTAEDPIPDDLRDTLALIAELGGAH
jgi:hypothetical protein